MNLILWFLYGAVKPMLPNKIEHVIYMAAKTLNNWDSYNLILS